METIKRIWNWIKDHVVAVGVGIVSIITLCDYYIHRRADERTAVWGYRDRAADAERLGNRIERTTELESEFIEECEEHIESARDTADRIEQSTISAEQALAELRRRFAEDQDKK